MTLRALELFAGIGGFAAAVEARATVVAAVDIDRTALSVYRGSFCHRTLVAAVESVPLSVLRVADLWWLSPPCQPFTRRGKRRDDEDPRARGLLALLPAIDRVRPPYLALENVVGFGGSQVHARLRQTLAGAGYEVVERHLCPTALSVPNRRPRFYLVAARSPGRLVAPSFPMDERPLRHLVDYLDRSPAGDLSIGAELTDRYRRALHLVDPRQPGATTACFTSAYGRSPVRSGSYLVAERGVRRFSPQEIARLLGLSPRVSLPPELSRERSWRLVGNSLSVPAVRRVLAAIPELMKGG